MKKNTLLVLIAGFMLSVLGCTKDPIITEPTNTKVEKPKPTNPGENKPGDNGGKPTDPSKPSGDAGVDTNKPNTVADFNNFESFKNSLNTFKLQPYATLAAGQGKDGKNALSIKGATTKNDYVFTTENQTVNANAKTITFFLKGTANQSLSFNVYKADGSYNVFNLRTDAEINSKTDIILSKDIVLKKTAITMNDSNTAFANNYVGVNINATNWIKVTLDLTGVDYNKSGKGSVFAFKVGKNGNYNLLIDSIVFDNNQPTTPTEPTEPEQPTTPNKPGEFNIPSDQANYYKGVDFKKTGIALKEELAKLVSSTHTKTLSYGDIWEASKATDLTPAGNEVYLLYGHKGTTTGTKAYTRGKQSNGGGQGQWNREHTYAKSLGTPNLGESGPGADGHHLRPADVNWNSARGNLKFAKGSGFSGPVSGGWYPGDEWRGDVARMMMYMYVRYNNRCLPTGVAVGSTTKEDNNMVAILLEWNAADPVSEIERNRNKYHANTANEYAQGNRNPFIDNPYLATQIWGGPEAKNLWK